LINYVSIEFLLKLFSVSICLEQLSSTLLLEFSGFKYCIEKQAVLTVPASCFTMLHCNEKSTHKRSCYSADLGMIFA